MSRKNLAASIRVGIWAGVGWGSLGRLHIKRDETNETSAKLLNDEIIGEVLFSTSSFEEISVSAVERELPAFQIRI